VNDVKTVWTNNAKTAAEDKELDDLVSALRGLSVIHVWKAPAMSSWKKLKGRSTMSAITIWLLALLLNQEIDIVAIRPYTICQCYYRCPLARCRLWSCLLVPLIRWHVQHLWLQEGCAAHRRTDEHQSTRKCQTGIPISFESWSSFMLEEVHIAKSSIFEMINDLVPVVYTWWAVFERHSSILTLIRAKRGEPVNHSFAR